MNRRLTPCTIVPPELYVIRDADKQLRTVLQDMGRPAYILVARQMGKTNLLLNAKRELDSPTTAVVYVDLSAPFESERECFRHIVDTAIGSRSDVFSMCQNSINEARKGALPPSYKEHENELRTLLDALPGKLIIVLDEIDSLTKGTFSDKIFAQIRSVYFSRTNYIQFNRLTYVLSGVVEPNEIIKDKRISPFNIGEKIYLDDFTYEQFLDFLGRAGLDVGKDVADRIYHWANGNPRLTWDICFDIEEKRSGSTTIPVERVDDAVRRLYLTDFTRAPIDHIREVVTADDELRNAITVIKYGKGNTLPDATKNRLYLAGIIRSAANHKDITIKNRIIEEALSDQWLIDVSVQKKGLARLAAEQYAEHNYENALALYEQLIANPDSSARVKNAAYWEMGLCAYHTEQYEKALGYLAKTHWDKEDNGFLYYERTFYIGACYLQIGNIEASRKQFVETLQTPKKNITYFNALINCGITFSTDSQPERAIELYQQALAGIDDSGLSSEDRIKVKTTALYSLAKAYSDKGARTKTQEHFQAALASSSPNQRPTIMLAMCQRMVNRDEKERVLTECVDLIISNKLRVDASRHEETLGLSTSVLCGLLRETFIIGRPLFNRLFAFANTMGEVRTPPTELLLRLAYLSIGNRDFESAVKLAREVIKKAVDGIVLNKETEFQTYRLLSILCKGKEKKRHQLRYCECLKTGYEPRSLDSTDLGIFADITGDLIKTNEPKDALEYINLAKQYKTLVARDQIAEYAVLNYFEMVAYRITRSWSRLKEVSQETLVFLESLKGCAVGSRLITADGLKQVEQFAKSSLDPSYGIFAEPLPWTQTRKYGRNERVSVRYRDGEIKRDVKFKNVENDLSQNRCELLEENAKGQPGLDPGVTGGPSVS